MQLFQFLFPFLYTRDWHSGRKELSRPRVVLFVGMISLIIIALLIAYFLQAPVTYSV